jgi:hypothetical protein
VRQISCGATWVAMLVPDLRDAIRVSVSGSNGSEPKLHVVDPAYDRAIAVDGQSSRNRRSPPTCTAAGVHPSTSPEPPTPSRASSSSRFRSAHAASTRRDDACCLAHRVADEQLGADRGCKRLRCAGARDGDARHVAQPAQLRADAREALGARGGEDDEGGVQVVRRLPERVDGRVRAEERDAPAARAARARSR